MHKIRPIWAVLAAMVAVGVLALPTVAAGREERATHASVPDGFTKVRGARQVDSGVFRTLPEGTAMGLRIRGFALIVRGTRGTRVKALAWGLRPRTTYGAHLHNAPCSEPGNPGGGHYMHDPAGPAMPPNELWLSSTADPMAGITSNAIGLAFGRGSADWVARPEAQSVVIHHIPPGGTTAGGPKIACADLH